MNKFGNKIASVTAIIEYARKNRKEDMETALNKIKEALE